MCNFEEKNWSQNKRSLLINFFCNNSQKIRKQKSQKTEPFQKHCFKTIILKIENNLLFFPTGHNFEKCLKGKNLYNFFSNRVIKQAYLICQPNRKFSKDIYDMQQNPGIMCKIALR